MEGSDGRRRKFPGDERGDKRGNVRGNE